MWPEQLDESDDESEEIESEGDEEETESNTGITAILSKSSSSTFTARH